MLVDDRTVDAAFYIDVNAAADSGLVATTFQSAVPAFRWSVDAVHIGDFVWAVDADDNACVALIRDMKDDWLELHMDESTWRPLAAIPGYSESATDTDRVSLAGVDPADALRALLRTPKPEA